MYSESRKYVIINMIYSAVKLIKIHFTHLSKWLNIFIELLPIKSTFFFLDSRSLSYSQNMSFYFSRKIHSLFFPYSISLKTERMFHGLYFIQFNLREKKTPDFQISLLFMCDNHAPLLNKSEILRSLHFVLST